MTRRRLKVHTWRIHNNKRYTCDLCGKQLKLKKYLQRHMNYQHLNEIYQCNMCGIMFRCNDSLMNHQIIKHGVDGTYKCEVCQKGFHQEYLLTQHKDKYAIYRDLCK